MPFKKGQSGNPAGRAKSTKYKINAEQRDFLRAFLLENKEKLILQLKNLEGKDFIHYYVTLMNVSIRPSTS